MNNKLLNAILAMDSYNREYAAGVTLGGNYLGDISIVKTSVDIGFKTDENGQIVLDGSGDTVRKDIDIGFYAIAYQYEDAGVTQTVISYRGTDQFLTANGIGGDIINAYSQGGGDAETNQSVMAIQFYQAVVDAVFGTDTGNYNVNGNLNNIMVTGHSMGGGLAGLVGGLYGLNGTIYSNMAYQQALLNLSRATNTTPDQLPNYTDLYSNEFYQLINNTYGPAYNGAINPAWLSSYAPNWSNLEAYTIAGEILNFGFPGGNSGEIGQR